jgi:ABC-type sugar transport system permease subunit
MHGKAPSRRELRRIAGDYLFLSPQLTLFVLLTIVPFIAAIPVQIGRAHV